MKYTPEIKAKCVELALSGVSLAEIQRTVGPNPKATQRYLVAVGAVLPKKEKVIKIKEPKEPKKVLKVTKVPSVVTKFN